MNGMLLNVASVTLMGGIILVIRRKWGGFLYPQVLKGLWILFFLCALFPMSSADRLGKEVIQRTEERKHSIEYPDRSDNGEGKEFYEGSKGLIEQYRLRRQLRGLALAVWEAGCILSLLYKVAGAGIFYHKGRKDCKYELSLEKQEEKGISFPVRIRITDNTGPMLLGTIIYVPERFFLGDDSLFRSIVLHEKEHINRKHHLVLALMNLTGCLYWFLPYVEKIFFQALREDMEYRCDYELIKNHAVEVGEYARHYIAIAEERGRICKELAFGEGGLKKRVRYMLQTGKKLLPSLWAGTMAAIMAVVCLVGIACYYRRDVNGFTRWEVEEAKEAILYNYEMSNRGDEKAVREGCVEDSPFGHATVGLTGRGYVIYDISYKPEHLWYFFAEKYMDAHNLDKRNCICLWADLEMDGGYYSNYHFYLVREDESGLWKLYDGGY